MICINFLTFEKIVKIIVELKLLINVKCREEVYSFKNYDVLMTCKLR